MNGAGKAEIPNDDAPRQYTEDEIRAMFLQHVWAMIDYWANVDEGKHDIRGRREMLSGFAHSMLAAIDGCSVGLPGFLLIPYPHESDREYLQGQGDNWFPEFHATEEVCDVSGGSLHELLYRHDPRRLDLRMVERCPRESCKRMRTGPQEYCPECGTKYAD
jgi:hypothetical protein